jgi:type I restriction enzyme S subunit
VKAMARFKWEVDFKDSEIGMLKTEGSAHYIFAHGVCGKIPKDWKIKRVDDDYKVNTGERVSPDSEGLFPVYGANGFSGYSQNFLIDKEAIITGRVGTIGQFFCVSGKANISDNALYITKKKEEAVIDFLYYALKLIFSNIEEVLNVGTTQPLIKQSEVRKFSVSFPEREEQFYIASVLSWFDDLIENKKRQNEVLENIAMAIFKSWFMYFEPFKSSAFVDSELGKIPEGWGIKRVSDVADIFLGGTPRREVNKYWNGTIKWASAKDIASTQGLFILETAENISQEGLDHSNAKILPQNSIVITARGTVGEIRLLGDAITFNQTCYGLVPKNDMNSYYLFLSLRRIIAEIKALSYGTVFDTITMRNFDEMKISIPPNLILEKFHSIVEPLFQKILLNQKQIMILRKVRDVLLPLLVFGKLRVEEI